MRSDGGIDLRRQVALVTGAGRGIGRAIAEALAGAGCGVALLARSAHELAETKQRIEKAGGRSLACPADVTNRETIEQTVAEVERKLGPIDLLVNNAGRGKPLGPLAEVDPDEWWRSVEVNLRGPLLCSRAVLPGMIARRRGRIINIASGAATRAIPAVSAYAVSKTALVRLTENLAAEVKDKNIQVFAVHPGTVRTTMSQEAIDAEMARKWIGWFIEIFETGRDVPADVGAKLVLVLASGRADLLSGRFLDATQDIEKVLGQAERIVAEDGQVLRLRTMT
jgi:NAD(P)-dependent dehydrogenase (short-subunit alcohol dehydrogenase family)